MLTYLTRFLCWYFCILTIYIQLERFYKAIEKNMKSDSDSSSDLDEEVYEVERIQGKRIRYGGVSKCSIRKFKYIFIFWNILTSEVYELANKLIYSHFCSLKFNCLKMNYIILIRLNTASNGKTIQRMTIHGSHWVICRVRRSCRNMRRNMRKMMNHWPGCRCPSEFWRKINQRYDFLYALSS